MGVELAGDVAWWVWPVALFVACFLLGIIAVPAGVGGGVLFVPIVAGFFPFHLDFVRGAGLLVALTGALAAGPRLLQNGLANLRLGVPCAVVASASSIAGALTGFLVDTKLLQVALGAAILAIVVIMAFVGNVDQPAEDWQARNTPAGLALFVVVGFIAGLFGLGAGWANVPVLNLVMGVPLKVAAGTSGLIIALSSSSAAWVYLHQGAILAIIAAPSIVGMMLGARIGAHVLKVVRAIVIRRLVIAMLFFAGIRALLKGLGIWT